MQIERNVVSAEDAKVFMRIAAAGAVVAQLETVIRERSPALATWLDAALQFGHFDVGAAVRVDKPDELKSACRPATSTLWGLITKPENFGGNDVQLGPDGKNLNAWGADEKRMVSYKPEIHPDVVEVLGRVAQRVADTANEYAKRSPSASLTATRDRNLLVFATIATSIDDLAFYKKVEAEMEPQQVVSAARFVPLTILEPGRTKQKIEQTLSFHPGTVAIHFGANEILKHHLDRGWQMASYAAYQSQDFPDSSQGMVELPSLMAWSSVRLQPSTLKQVYGTLSAEGMTQHDRVKFGELMSNLVSHTYSIAEWERIVLDTGIVDADPKKSMYQAARVASVPVLEASKDRVRWPEDFDWLGHPALQVITGSGESLNTEENAVEKSIEWFFKEVTQRGIGAVEDLFKATNSDATLAEDLIRTDRLSLLHRMLEMGLDADRRVHGKARSAIDAAVDHGKPAAEAMIRAFQARSVANDALAELGMEVRP